MLQEKKKDKWADYAMQYASNIEVEGGIAPRDKWDKYVKNCIEAGDSPLLRKAEKKIVVEMSYSTDEDEEDEKNKKKKPINKDKNDKLSASKNDSSDSESDKNSDHSDSEEEGDLHARLLASMEKEAIPEETEEDLMTPRSSKPDPKPSQPTSGNPPKPKETPKQNNNSKPTPASSNVPEKVVTKPAANKPKQQPTKADQQPKSPANLKIEPVNNKNYKNGPVVDFQEQIRKISSLDQPDLSQMVIPEKPENIPEGAGKASKPHDDEIHHAINDILKDEDKGARPRTGRRRSSVPSRPASGDSGPSKEPVVDNDKKLKELEEDIVKNHKEGGNSNRKHDDETMKKGAEVDSLISELNLAV